MIATYIPLILIVIFLAYRKKTKSVKLSPFEYSYTTQPGTRPKLPGFKISTENLVTILLLMATVPPIMYSALHYLHLSGTFSYDAYAEYVGTISIVIAGIVNLGLIAVAFSLQHFKRKSLLIGLIILQFSLYLIETFYN